MKLSLLIAGRQILLVEGMFTEVWDFIYFLKALKCTIIPCYQAIKIRITFPIYCM